jgi:hypothetical protein
MNQDDTFRKLAQRPYEEVLTKLRMMPMPLTTEWRTLVKENGWTPDEWLIKMGQLTNGSR